MSMPLYNNWTLATQNHYSFSFVSVESRVVGAVGSVSDYSVYMLYNAPYLSRALHSDLQQLQALYDLPPPNKIM